MKTLVFFLYLGVYAPALFAQTPFPPASKYWIYFTNKVGAAGKVAAVEPGYVSQKARQRRVLRGTPPAPGLDAPISGAYVAALQSLGVVPLVRSRWLNAMSAWLSNAERDAVAALPFVRAVRPVGVAARPPLPDPPASGAAAKHAATYRIDYGLSQAQLELMNAIAPLEREINGAGVVIGFLDTEFDAFSHPAFADLVSGGRLLGVQRFVNGPQSSTHGWRVASAAVGFAEGMLVGPGYGAQVLAATTEYVPTETNQEEDNFVAGLEWLESQGADVVNVSLGYTTFDEGQRSYVYEDMDGNTAVTTVAADRAAALGVVMVVSAGNSGGCGGPSPTCWHHVGSPADGDSVITVGSVQRDSSRASSSSFGPTADGRFKPDVAALGSEVYVASTSDGYGYGSGTSFASPLVAGVVSQMLQVNPALTPTQVRDILRSTASQAGQPDNVLGWGIVNANAAVAAAEAAIVTHAEQEQLPERVHAVRVYPNPFSQRVMFEFDAPAFIPRLQLTIYDVRGRRVATAPAISLQPGRNHVPFDRQGLPAGVYLYVLQGDNFRRAGQLVIAP